MSLTRQAGDIEFNPGPRTIDLNRLVCAICSKKINRETNLEAVGSCCNDKGHA